MMKGRKGGYVLVYVLIVIVIVSALGLAVCSASLRNLQVQAAAVRQMKDKYAAEGEIERFCAWLLEQTVDTNFETTVKDYPASAPVASAEVHTTVEPAGSNSVIVTATSGSVTVTAVLKVDVVTSGGDILGIEYKSYTIGTSGA